MQLSQISGHPVPALANLPLNADGGYHRVISFKAGWNFRRADTDIQLAVAGHHLYSSYSHFGWLVREAPLWLGHSGIDSVADC